MDAMNYIVMLTRRSGGQNKTGKLVLRNLIFKVQQNLQCDQNVFGGDWF